MRISDWSSDVCSSDLPVQGFRPSADLLFATIAKTAGANGVGMILTGMGRDGAAGLKALRGAGGKTFAQDNATCMVYEAPAAAVAQGAVEQQLPLDGLAAAALGAAGKLAKADRKSTRLNSSH